jgi:hypothetical protein
VPYAHFPKVFVTEPGYDEPACSGLAQQWVRDLKQMIVGWDEGDGSLTEGSSQDWQESQIVHELLRSEGALLILGGSAPGAHILVHLILPVEEVVDHLLQVPDDDVGFESQLLLQCIVFFECVIQFSLHGGQLVFKLFQVTWDCVAVV